MHNAALLINENTALHTANQKQKQKQGKTIISISQESILTVQEGQVHTQNAQNGNNVMMEQSAIQSKTKTSLCCSLCRSYKYTAQTYTQCYSNK